MKEKILLLGGTGKISSRIAPLLSLNSYSVVLASRSGSAPSSLRNCHGVKFDWLDLTSYLNPFNNNNISANSETFSAIFLVAPPVLNGFLLMKEFIDLAIAKGVKRFVLLSGSLLDVGDGPMLRRVSEYIISCDVEYTFLRPSWFMENFSEMHHRFTIRDEDRIVTATGDGKVSFVSADDVAMIAYGALTDEVPHNTDHILLGPELLSYDDVAETLTKILGRKITHAKVTKGEIAARMCKSGLPEDYAKTLAELDTAIRMGKEARLNDVLFNTSGRPPKRFEDYVKDCVKKEVW